MGFVLERADEVPELFPVPQKNGYSFVQWIDESGKGLSCKTLEQDKIFYAEYKDDIPPEMQVLASSDVASTQRVELIATDEGSGVTGYYFGKENPENTMVSFSEETVKTVSEAGVYYAAVKDGEGNVTVDEVEFFVIELELNGGTLSTDRIILLEGTEMTPPEPEKMGYSGTWRDVFTNVEAITFVADGEKVYTVLWTPNQYQLSFDGNGGTCEVQPRLVTFDAAYGELPIPIPKNGYTFKGWYTLQTGGVAIQAETIVTTAKNHTLYAQWNYTHVHSAGCYKTTTCTLPITCREHGVFDDGAISYTHVCPSCGGVGGGRCGGGHSGQTCGRSVSKKICGLP